MLAAKRLSGFLKREPRNDQYPLERLAELEHGLVLVRDLVELDHWKSRLRREYLETSIVLSDTFELDFDIHGLIDSCRVIYSLAAFKPAQFRRPVEPESAIAVVLSDESNAAALGGAVDLDLGELWRDDAQRIVWTGISTGTQVTLSDGVRVFFDGSFRIIGVSAPYQLVA
jgi:hypothetical protein